ncbi:MAG TPA: heparan-alpha-glucosaminide N-acetyltransferase domain-containing protein [Candidatus Binatia bacterium]
MSPERNRPARTARQAIGTPDRLESLDAMRGLTVAGMILVNNPGSWTEGYPLLAHSTWNGCTLADLVFPSFLLIVGVSIDLSLSRRVGQGAAGRPLAMALVRRALLLFALGVLLNGFPEYAPLSTLRLFGVLQRIALCSLAGGVLFLTAGAAAQALAVVVLLVGYWLAMTLVPVPGLGAGALEPHANLVGWLDDWLFHGHLYRESFDPEGLLSTLPAIATTLIGMLAGRWLRTPIDGRRKTLGLLVAGIALAAAGEIADRWFPINKQLWTSSFALLAGGLGLVVLAACYWLVDRRGWRRVARPFVMLGANALAVYLLSTMVARLMELCQVGAGDTCESLRLFLYERLFEPWAGALTGSLLFAVAYLLVWMVPTTELYRRRLFLRI